MSASTAFGIVTIGQSPRTDLVPEMAGIIGEVEIIEHGALDGLSPDEIRRMAPTGDDTTLVTRLRDGSSVVIAESRVIPLVEDAVAALEQRGVGVTLLVCTGPFPPLRHERPLLPADRLYRHAVAALAEGAHLGIVCPLPEQEAMTAAKWASNAGAVKVTSASPYAERDAVGTAAQELVDVDFVLLDCMGFDGEHRRLVSEKTGKHVLLARSLVARLAAEVVV